MSYRPRILIAISLLILLALACQLVSGLPAIVQTTEVPSSTPSVQPTETLTPTPLPLQPVKSGAENPDEPVYVTGSIPYTSPFFVASLSEPFVMLEDQSGFVHRDKEFQFPLQSQVIGPVEVHDDQKLTFELALPEIPQGTFQDVDNNGRKDTGVQIFAVSYWSNTWGGPFLEKRDGTGWSSSYASTRSDSERDDEIIGGTLIVWAPDSNQSFPTGFGPDGLLFTADDPTGPISAGYNLVDLDKKPFRFYKQARANLTLIEGEGAVNDYSKLSYGDAFDQLFKKVSREYPFTEEKKIDWQALYNEFSPRFQNAKDEEAFYRAMIDFTSSIPDGHIGFSSVDDEIYRNIFFQEHAGGFGLILAELSDGRVIVTKVLPDTPASKAGIQPEAELLTWDGKPIGEAIDAVVPFFGPSSSNHARRLQQLAFLTHVQPDSQVEVTYKNPGDTQEQRISMTAAPEVASLFDSLPFYNVDELALPIQAEILKDSGIAYIKITSFSDDYNLTAHLWTQYIQKIIDNKVPGIILDLRINGGGNPDLGNDIAGYFFDKEMILSQGYYLSDKTGKFEPEGLPEKVTPGPKHYDGPVAVLVGPDCASACEGFAYAMSQDGRATLIGNYPTAGMFGEVGRGQYNLPDKMSLQFPTGRPITPDGKVLIEGQGVAPDITVPVTEDSAMGKTDTVLDKAIEVLQKEIDQKK